MGAVVLLLTATDGAVTYPDITTGGSCTNPLVCPCSRTLNASSGDAVHVDVVLQFRPSTNPLPPKSLFTSPSAKSNGLPTTTVGIVNGATLPPIVLEFVSRASANQTLALVTSYCGSPTAPFTEPLLTLDGSTVFINSSTIRAVAEVGRSVSVVMNTSVAAVGGVLTLDNVVIFGSAGTEFYLVINTSIGLWIMSPYLVMYDDVASADHSLEIVEDGENPLSALPCFGVSRITIGGPALQKSVTLAVRDFAHFVSTDFDGLSIVIAVVVSGSGSNSPSSVVASFDGDTTIVGGFASIRGLRFTATPGFVPNAATGFGSAVRIVFSVENSDGVVLSCTSRALTLVAAPVQASFLSPAPSSFIQSFMADVSWKRAKNASGIVSDTAMMPAVAVTIGVPMRRIVLRVVDDCGEWNSAASGFFVRVSSSGGAVLSGQLFAAVSGGEAVFDNIVVQFAPHVNPGSTFSPAWNTSRAVLEAYYLSFHADPQSSVSDARPLYSQKFAIFDTDINRSGSAVRLRGFRNQLSLQSSAAAYSVPAYGPFPLPVAAIVIGKDAVIDPVVSCTMRLSGPLLPVPMDVPLIAGVAEWPLVELTGGVASQITWLKVECLKIISPLSSNNNSALNVTNAVPVAQSLLVSPIVLLNPSSPFLLQFEPVARNPFSAHVAAIPGPQRFATAHIPLPCISLEILQMDNMVAEGIDDHARVIIVGQGVRVDGGASVVRRGRVVFPELRLACPPALGYTLDASLRKGCKGSLLFIVVAPLDVATGLNGTTLSVPDIFVAASVVPRFALMFLNGSYVEYHGQPLAAAIGYPLPPIGVGLVDSAHQLDTSMSSMLSVEVSLTSGWFVNPLNSSASAGVSSQRLPLGPDGTVWFRSLAISNGTAPLESRMRFYVRYGNNAAALNLTQYNQFTQAVMSRCLVSGVIGFQRPSDPMLLALQPLLSRDGSQVAVIPTVSMNATDIGFGSEALLRSTRFINQTGDPIVLVPNSGKMVMQICAMNSALVLALPSQSRLAVLNLTSSVSELSVTTMLTGLDSRPSVYPDALNSIVTAVLSPDDEQVFASTAADSSLFVRGATHSLTVASTWIPSRPLRLGPVILSTNVSSVEDVSVVLVLIVGIRSSTFDEFVWLTEFSSAYRIPVSQLEPLRVRTAGDIDGSWSGVRIEVRVSAPTTSTVGSNRVSDIVGKVLKGSNPVCHSDDIRLKFKFQSGDAWPYCDAYALDEQAMAAHLCESASGVTFECSCYVDFFEAAPQACLSSTEVANLCANLGNCRSAAIINGCSSYKSSVYMQYALIAVYVVLAGLIVSVVLMWRNKVFSKCSRDTVGNRGRRDIEYGGLALDKNEGVDAGATFF